MRDKKRRGKKIEREERRRGWGWKYGAACAIGS